MSAGILATGAAPSGRAAAPSNRGGGDPSSALNFESALAAQAEPQQGPAPQQGAASQQPGSTASASAAQDRAACERRSGNAGDRRAHRGADDRHDAAPADRGAAAATSAPSAPSSPVPADDATTDGAADPASVVPEAVLAALVPAVSAPPISAPATIAASAAPAPAAPAAFPAVPAGWTAAAPAGSSVPTGSVVDSSASAAGPAAQATAAAVPPTVPRTDRGERSASPAPATDMSAPAGTAFPAAVPAAAATAAPSATNAAASAPAATVTSAAGLAALPGLRIRSAPGPVALDDDRKPVAAPAGGALDPSSVALATPSAPVQQAAPAAPVAPVAAPSAPADPEPALAAQLAPPITALAGASPGEHIVTVRVSPENLGPVTVRAHVADGSMRVELFAADSRGRDALAAMLPDLRRDLAGGAATASTTVGLGTGDAPQGGSRDGSGAADRDSPFRGGRPVSIGGAPSAPAPRSPSPIPAPGSGRIDVLA